MLLIHTRFLRLLASCLLLALAFPALADDSVPLDIPNAKAASPVTYVDVQGTSHTLNPKDSKLTIVHFWASWCAPCVAELPQLDATAAAYDGKELKILALSLDGDNMGKVKQFLFLNHITHLTPYLDANMISFSAIGSQGLPTTLFIDSNGQEIARAEGPLDWKSKEVTDFIEKHLQ